MVEGIEQDLLRLFRHYFSCIASQVASMFTFIIDRSVIHLSLKCLR